MPPRHRVLLLVLLVVCSAFSACVSLGLGNVRYDGSTLHVRASNSGNARDAAIQVTVFQVRALSQTEVVTRTVPITLLPGDHEYTVPLALPAGSYKLYLYLIMDNDRKASVIRDITV